MREGWEGFGIIVAVFESICLKVERLLLQCYNLTCTRLIIVLPLLQEGNVQAKRGRGAAGGSEEKRASGNSTLGHPSNQVVGSAEYVSPAQAAAALFVSGSGLIGATRELSLEYAKRQVKHTGGRVGRD